MARSILGTARSAHLRHPNRQEEWFRYPESLSDVHPGPPAIRGVESLPRHRRSPSLQDFVSRHTAFRRRARPGQPATAHDLDLRRTAGVERVETERHLVAGGALAATMVAITMDCWARRTACATTTKGMRAPSRAAPANRENPMSIAMRLDRHHVTATEND